MSAEELVHVRHLGLRLEEATVSERLEALEELQRLSRQGQLPVLVCEETLPRLMQVLQERGSSEEYIECLYVLDSLVKCREDAHTAANAAHLTSWPSIMQPPG